jgi:hypothetical protein
MITVVLLYRANIAYLRQEKALRDLKKFVNPEIFPSEWA